MVSTGESSYLYANTLQGNGSGWASRLVHGPCRILLFLIAIALLTVASAIVIVTANTRPVVSSGHFSSPHSLLYRPTAIVSALSSAANFLIHTVLTGIIATIWWRSARTGTTIANLHYMCAWKNTDNMKNKLSSREWKEVRMVILATLMATIMSLATGPMYQRSLSTSNQNVQSNITMDFHLADRIPNNWTGDPGTNTWSSKFLDQLAGWFDGNPIPSYQCNGNCTASVLGAGLVSHCTTQQSDLDLLDKSNGGSPVFSINVTKAYDATRNPILRLVTNSVETVNHLCVGNLITTTCDVRPSGANYSLVFSEKAVFFNGSDSVGNSYTYLDDTGSHPVGPLDGLLHFSNLYWNVSTLLTFQRSNTDLEPSVQETSLLTRRFITNEPQPTYNGSSERGNLTVVPQCSFTYADPSQNVINSLNEIMFRCAYSSFNAATAAAGTLQPLAAQQRVVEAVYTPNYFFLAGATSLVLATLLVLGFLLWAFWDDNAGKLDPLDLALAFSSPLLDAHTDVKAVIANVGKQRVRLCEGKLQVDDEHEKLQHEELPGLLKSGSLEVSRLG